MRIASQKQLDLFLGLAIKALKVNGVYEVCGLKRAHHSVRLLRLLAVNSCDHPTVRPGVLGFWSARHPDATLSITSQDDVVADAIARRAIAVGLEVAARQWVQPPIHVRDLNNGALPSARCE